MTKFSITTNNSIHTTADFSDAFAGGSVNADSLTVKAGAHLKTDGMSSTAAVLDNSLAWNVNVEGTIASQKVNGLWLAVGNEGMSEITVAEGGEVLGGFDGIFAQSAVTIENYGLIEGTAAGVEVYGNQRHRLFNEGSITGAYSFLNADGASNDLIKNSGVMTGAIDLGAGNDRLVNTGELLGLPKARQLSFDFGDDIFVNHGTAKIDIGDDDGADKVINSGLIDGTVNLGVGDDVFVNFVKAGGKATSGAVSGQIQLGDGNDVLEGGNGVEDYRDGAGSDTINFRGGNDVYRVDSNAPTDGLDRIDGGKGIDTYDASTAIEGVYINLSSVDRELPFRTGYALVEAGSAIGEDVGGNASDRILSFENVFGGLDGDIIFGSAKGNYIDGGAGMDALYGGGGEDYLVGGNSFDQLTGGAGKDLLSGGEGQDMFIFSALGESGTTAKTRDVITDYQAGFDNIDLRGIDAVKDTTDDDEFDFIGTDVAFTGRAGELRVYHDADGQVVEGDVDGDGAADFSIGVSVGANVVLQTSDFEL